MANDAPSGETGDENAIDATAPDLDYSTYVALARVAQVDWRTIREEWRKPGSVKGQAGIRARTAIAQAAKGER